MEKSMWESAEAFEAHAIIGFCYWRLGELQKEMNKPLAPITRMVDKACGFDRDAALYPEIVLLLREIIEQKKFIGAETANDEEMLKTMQQHIEIRREG